LKCIRNEEGLRSRTWRDCSSTMCISSENDYLVITEPINKSGSPPRVCVYLSNERGPMREQKACESIINRRNREIVNIRRVFKMYKKRGSPV